jgi:large subunit ribosomal protein L4
MAQRASKPARRPAGAAKEPEAPTVSVVDASNRTVGETPVSAEVFGGRVNRHLLYEAVKQYRAAGRRGTHMTKNRALVSGSGRKPWRQKGTGRARVGETRNPLWRHGGTVFGPTPRDYAYAMPRKARLAALRSALSLRMQEGGLKVIDAFPIEKPRTRELKAVLDRLGAAGKTLIVEAAPTEALLLSGRNLPGVSVKDASHVQAYDVLDCRFVLLSQRGLAKLEERLTP